MTLDQIDRMVRQANPVPDLFALEPIDPSVLDQQRRTEMQTHDRVIVDDEGDEPKRGRNLLIGIAAAAAIIIGALLLLRPLTEETPVADHPTTTSAVETAAAFVEAYRVNFDIDRAFSHLAATAEGFGPVEEERLLARFLQAIESKTILGPCEELSTSPSGTRVSCSFKDHSLRSDEMGLGPYGGGSYELTVLDGEVTSFESKLPPNFINNPNGFSRQVWEPFADWVAEVHPDDVAIMYEDVSQTRWRITEESIPLWEQRSREYVDVVRAKAVDVATAFVDAWRSFDVSLVATYLASDADLSSFEWGGGTWQMNNRLAEAQGFEMLVETCEEVPASTAISCAFDFHNFRSNEVGTGPFGGNRFDVWVEGGEVVSAQIHLDISEFGPQMWDPFEDWLAGNHPADGPVMYTTWPNATLERLSEESIALWAQRTQEYADAVRAGQ
jgi:hypothetical protein